DIARLKKSDLSDKLQQVYYQNAPALVKYQVSLSRLFEDVLSNLDGADAFDTDGVILTRIGIKTKYNGVEVGFNELLTCLEGDYDSLNKILGEEDRRLFEDILSDTISRKIRDKIRDSKVWVKQMNTLMESMDTSSGLKLSLRWVPKKSDTEDQLDTKELVDILQVDPELMRQEDMDKLTGHFRSRIYEARRMGEELNNTESFYKLMKDTLDYRQWYEFRLYYSKTGEKKRELTNHIFFAFSGGEKAMSMYVPLFSAVKAKYMGAKDDAPLVIALDEAFAGVDDNNIKDMFRLVIKLDFSFIMNSQSLWGDYETVPSLAIYQLLRPENAKCVSVISYVWNGHIRKML
ncbi:MAG: TIGR02680 family protein, partial [Lachnospiraceae bacterium]|nr:TIGR02680 family protein [Lachnospiraceae bacterium]